MFGEASIDASGSDGGGVVLIGGDFQGKNPEIQNAEFTYVGENTSINADAVEQGVGGEVIIWADNTTRFYGSISSRGGEISGDGGFAEVSGHRLIFQGQVDLSSPHGNTGNLLLDPLSIKVVASGGEVNLAGTGNPSTDDGNENIYAFSEDPTDNIDLNASVIVD